MIIIKNFKLLKLLKINGIVLYPLVIFASKDPHPEIQNHERIHIDQIKKAGPLRFYRRYLKEYFQGRLQGLTHQQAYLNISYEKEAYRHQKNEKYLV